MENVKKTGTTTIGIVCKDGIVMANSGHFDVEINKIALKKLLLKLKNGLIMKFR